MLKKPDATAVITTIPILTILGLFASAGAGCTCEEGPGVTNLTESGEETEGDIIDDPVDVAKCAPVLGEIAGGVRHQCRGGGDVEISADLSCNIPDTCFGIFSGDSTCIRLKEDCPDFENMPDDPRLLFEKLFEFTFDFEDVSYEDSLVSACCTPGCNTDDCDLEVACEGACANMVCENVPKLLTLLRSSDLFLAEMCCRPTTVPDQFDCFAEDDDNNNPVFNEGPLLDVCMGMFDAWIQQTKAGFSSQCLAKEILEAEGEDDGCHMEPDDGSCGGGGECSCGTACWKTGTCCHDLCEDPANANQNQACWRAHCKVEQQMKVNLETEPAFLQEFEVTLVDFFTVSVPAYIRGVTFNANCNSPIESPTAAVPDESPIACVENEYNPALPPKWPQTEGDIEPNAIIPEGPTCFRCRGWLRSVRANL